MRDDRAVARTRTVLVQRPASRPQPRKQRLERELAGRRQSSCPRDLSICLVGRGDQNHAQQGSIETDGFSRSQGRRRSSWFQFLDFWSIASHPVSLPVPCSVGGGGGGDDFAAPVAPLCQGFRKTDKLGVSSESRQKLYVTCCVGCLPENARVLVRNVLPEVIGSREASCPLSAICHPPRPAWEAAVTGAVTLRVRSGFEGRRFGTASGSAPLRATSQTQDF